jgi:hypothetical protein
MADLSITAANVLAGANANIFHGRGGATITAGQVLYEDATTSRFGLADNNSATAAVKLPAGIALNGGANGQPMAVHRDGDITIGATLTPGTAYFLSDTPGGICPAGDLASGETVVQIGIAKSASVLSVDIKITGVTL